MEQGQSINDILLKGTEKTLTYMSTPSANQSEEFSRTHWTCVLDNVSFGGVVAKMSQPKIVRWSPGESVNLII